MSKKHFLSGLLVGLILSCLLVGIFPGYTETLSKRLIGAEDVYWATGGTGAAETFNYVTGDGYTLTLTKLDASHLKFRTAQDATAKSVEALVDGTNTIHAKLKSLTVSTTSTFTGIATFEAFPITPSAAPTTNYQVANKKYVDDEIGSSTVPTAIQKQTYTAAAAAGTVDAITADFTPDVTLTDKTRVCVIASGANTSPAPTFAPDGLTAKTIVKGSDQALEVGDIPGANFPMDLEYNSSLQKWVLLNPAYAVNTTTIKGKGHYAGLIVKNNAGTPTTQIDIDADSVMVADGSGNLFECTAVNLTVDCTTTGANALDAGSLSATTWYYFFVIYNSSTSDVAGLVSLSATSPTMPSGYTYKKLVSCVRTSAGSTFDTFKQLGSILHYGLRISVISEGTEAGYTAVNCSTFAPPAPYTRRVLLGVGASGVSCTLALSWDGTNAYLTYYATQSYGEMPVSGSNPDIYYLVSSGSAYIWGIGVDLNI